MRKYTKEERLKIANVFRLARNKLWNGKSAKVPRNKQRWICFSIVYTMADFMHEAKEIVQKRLGNHLYVNEFLESKGIKNFSNKELQEYRRLWLIELEREFSQ